MAAAALAALAAVGASGVQAQGRTVEIPLKKLFPYLEPYLSLPPQARSKFVMVYRMEVQGAAPSAVTLTYPGGGVVPIAADGRVRRLPTLSMLQANGKAVAAAPKGSKVGVDLALEPVMQPAADLEARELSLAVTQAAAGAKKAAGVFGFAVPKFDRVVFKGAAGGQAIRADGSAVALPVVKGDPVFEPARHGGAVRLRFARPPSRMTIGGG
jgi:hypothetical protein